MANLHEALETYNTTINEFPLYTPEEEFKAATALSALRDSLDMQIFSKQVLVPHLYKMSLERMTSNRYDGKTSKKLEEIGSACESDVLIEKVRKLSPDFKQVSRSNFSKVLNEYEKAIKNQDYNMIEHFQQLTGILPGSLSSEKKQFSAKLEQYNQLYEEFFNKNLRLLVSIARKMPLNSERPSDMLQDGSSGLMRAVEAYEPERGNKFSTFAVTCIKRDIFRGLRKNGAQVRLPEGLHPYVTAFLDAAAECQLREFTQEDLDSLSETLGIGKETTERIYNYMLFLSDPISLSSELHNNDGDTLEDIISPPELTLENAVFSLEDDALSNVHAESILKILKKGLKPREYDVLVRRSVGEETLQAVGDYFGVTRERIRQIEAKALEKAKKLLSAANLADYL